MLDNQNKNNPFRVPDNYFQNFNTEIMNMLPEKEVSKTKAIPLWKTATRWAAVAATITGLAFVGVNYLTNSSSVPVDAGMADPARASDESQQALENEYYLFLEEEAINMAYKDVVYNEDLF